MDEQAPLTFLNDLNESQTQNAIKIAEAAKKVGVNPRLAVSIAYAESRLNSAPDDSDKGAIGMMQVLPSTGKMLGFSEKDLRNPEKNLEAGLMYLKQGYDKFGDPAMTAAGYHAGYDHKFFEDPKNKLGPKTMQYVKDIQSYGGFTEPTATTEGNTEGTTEGTTEGGNVDDGFRGPPAPASNADFLAAKARGMFDNMTMGDVGAVAGAGAGAIVGPKVGGALQSLKQSATPTGGELWAKNWAGQNRPGVSVPEATAGYQRSKGQGKVSGRVSQMYGPRAPVEPGVFQPGRLSLPQRPNTPPITPLAGKVAQYGGALLNSPLGQKVTGALGGYGAATQGMEAYQRAQGGDKLGAAIAGAGALGSGVAAIPTPVTRIGGGALSMLSPAALWMLDHARKMSPENAQGALQGTDQMGNPIQ